MDPRPYTYQFRKPRLSNPTYKSNNLYESIYHMGAYGKIYPNLDKISNKIQATQGFTINPNQEKGSKQSNSQKLQSEIMKIDPYYENFRNERNRQQPEVSTNTHIQQYQQYGARNEKQPTYQYQAARGPALAKQAEIRHQQLKGQGKLEGYNFSKQLHNEIAERQDNFSQSRSYSQDSKNIKPRQQQHEPGYMSGYGSKLLYSPTPRRGGQDAVFERQQKPYNIINCYPKEVLNTHRAHPKYTLENKLIESGHYPYIPINPERIYDNR